METKQLSVTEVAAELGLTRTRVVQLCQKGMEEPENPQRLHPMRIGNYYVITSAELARFRKLKRPTGCHQKK